MGENPPDVIAIVLTANKLRSSQHKAIKQIKTAFGKYFNQAILLLTNGGGLKGNEPKFIKKKGSKKIQSLYRSVGKRYVVFENSASMEEKQKYTCKFKNSILQIIKHQDSSTSL